VEKGKVAAEATKVAFERAEQLLRDKAGNQRSVDEARAQLLLAQATLKAAEAHRDLLLSVTSAAQAGTISSLAIPAPMDGMLRNVHAVPGQIVAAGAPLFEVFLLDRLWVRLPVYAGDLAGIETEKEARVSRLGEAPGAAGRAARPVPAPPSADAGAASVDLFYELENAGGTLRPGEKVGVTVALRVPEESLVVPWSAVVHDIHGGTWVYELAAPHTFRRRRVEVSYVAGSLATLASGPGPGESVVSEGAAELFGTEFGIGK
jgi:RND family efflux transporter MFP subunit